MKLKTRRLFLFLTTLLVVGCTPNLPDFKFKVGDCVRVTCDGLTATGTVLRAEYGQDPKCPEEPYYEIDFGPLDDGPHRLNIMWFPKKFITKLPPTTP